METHNKSIDVTPARTLVSPEAVNIYILPRLRRGERQAILEAIMACSGAMVRVFMDVQWFRDKEYPDYTFQGVQAISRQLHEDLARYNPDDPGVMAYHPRIVWREALGCTRSAGHRSRPPLQLGGPKVIPLHRN